jgi:hypothetical protein
MVSRLYMARKKKFDENGEKQEPTLATVQTDIVSADLSEVTNINATIFCPYILHKKDYMPRKCPTGLAKPNNYYRWWQRKDYSNVQFCKLKRTAEDNYEKCWHGFKKCDDYLDKVNEIDGLQRRSNVHVGEPKEETD